MSSITELWNFLPSYSDLRNFNLAEKFGIGILSVFMMAGAIYLIYYIFSKATRPTRIAAMHTFGPMIIVLLSSCSLPHTSQEPKIHPTLPAQVEPVDIDLKVSTIEGKPMVMMSWEDSQKFRVWLADIKRYTLESKLIMCYYRKELNEERCKPKEK